jgi:hypothetical protein
VLIVHSLLSPGAYRSGAFPTPIFGGGINGIAVAYYFWARILGGCRAQVTVNFVTGHLSLFSKKYPTPGVVYAY